MTARNNHSQALEQLLALRREVAVPDDLARRIVVRTASLPQQSVAAGASAPPTVTSLARPARNWVPLGAGIAASLALMLALPQMAVQVPGQSVQQSRPQVAAVDPPAMPVLAPVVSANGAATPAVAAQPTVAMKAAVPVVADEPAAGSGPAQLAQAEMPEAVPATPAPTASWHSGKPVNFALVADTAKPEVYGPVLDPAATYGSASVRLGGTIGLGIADGGGGMAPR